MHVDRKKISKYEAPRTPGRRREGPTVANSSAEMKTEVKKEERV